MAESAHAIQDYQTMYDGLHNRKEYDATGRARYRPEMRQKAGGKSQHKPRSSRAVERFFILKAVARSMIKTAQQAGEYSVQQSVGMSLNKAFDRGAMVYVLFSAKKSGAFQAAGLVTSRAKQDHTNPRRATFSVEFRSNYTLLEFKEVEHLKQRKRSQFSVTACQDGQEICFESGRELVDRLAALPPYEDDFPSRHSSPEWGSGGGSSEALAVSPISPLSEAPVVSPGSPLSPATSTAATLSPRNLSADLASAADVVVGPTESRSSGWFAGGGSGEGNSGVAASAWPPRQHSSAGTPFSYQEPPVAEGPATSMWASNAGRTTPTNGFTLDPFMIVDSICHSPLVDPDQRESIVEQGSLPWSALCFTSSDISTHLRCPPVPMRKSFAKSPCILY